MLKIVRNSQILCHDPIPVDLWEIFLYKYFESKYIPYLISKRLAKSASKQDIGEIAANIVI